MSMYYWCGHRGAVDRMAAIWSYRIRKAIDFLFKI